MSTETLYDDAAEQAVLGAVLVNNARLDDVADSLEAEQFRRHGHQIVYRAMLSLHMAGQPIDLLTLKSRLERDGSLEDAGGVATLSRLTEGVPKSTNITHYAAIVREKHLKRSLMSHGQELLRQAEADVKSGAELLELAEQEIYRLGQRAVKTDWLSAEELAGELYPVVEQMVEQRSGLSGLSTGFTDLDEPTRGLQNSDLILLGARPSQGKSALALQIAMHAAQTVPVAFFSVEMGRQSVGLRGVIAQAQVDGFRLLKGYLSDVDHRRVSEGLSRFGGLALFVDESPSLTPLQARSKLRRLKSRAGRIGLVVVDYLQLMAPLPDDRKENRTTQVAGISRALKILAREFACPFLVLSQLNRGLERSTDKRPNLSDLRESGALEQDADVVLLLHRPEVYEPDNAALSGIAEVILAKHRNGPVGTVTLTWRGPQMRFENRSYQ